MYRKEIRIGGFGGQGVILSGQIIGKAACVFSKGYATLTQNYGPESRGGASCAEVAISDEPIAYPYITNPELQVLLAQEAYNKYGVNPPPGVVIIVDSDLVKVDAKQSPPPLAIPASRLAREEMGRPIVANIIVLGFLAAVSDIVSKEALKNAVLDSIPSGTESTNVKAFELGYDYGVKHGRKG